MQYLTLSTWLAPLLMTSRSSEQSKYIYVLLMENSQARDLYIEIFDILICLEATVNAYSKSVSIL